MNISFQSFPNGLWHKDCDFQNRSSPMLEVSREESRTLLECAACGKRGYFPVGGVGCVKVDEVVLK